MQIKAPNFVFHNQPLLFAICLSWDPTPKQFYQTLIDRFLGKYPIPKTQTSEQKYYESLLQ